MALSLAARKRLSILVLVVGMPAWVVVAVTVVNWADRTWGRLPLLAELAVYVCLGVLWILPFRALFRGVGQPAPRGKDDNAPGKDDNAPGKDDGAPGKDG